VAARPPPHAAALVGGYLLAWAAFGLIAFGISRALAKLAPLKARCLRHRRGCSRASRR